MSIFQQNTINPLLGNDYQNDFAMQKASNYNLYQYEIPNADLSFLNDNNYGMIGPQNQTNFNPYTYSVNGVTPIEIKEEQEIEDADEAEAMEYGRRNLIQQKFTPLQTPNNIPTLKTQSANDIFNQNRNGILKDKKNELKDFRKSLKTTGDTRWDWKWSDKDGNMKDHSALGKGLGIGLSTAAAVGDNLLNNSYKGNQGAYVSGAFGKNQMYDDIYNTNTTIAATNFNDAYQQQRGITNQLNAQKTQELSGGQIAGMVGTGAAKGASAGAAFGPWGMLIGGVVGGAAGGAKGMLANNKIKDSNLLIGQKQQEANNYMQNAMSGIRQRNSNLQKQSAYNMYAYNNAYGGQLNKKHKVGDVIDIDSKTMKQMLDEGYTFEKSYDVDDVIDIDDNELKKLKKLGYEYEIV